MHTLLRGLVSKYQSKFLGLIRIVFGIFFLYNEYDAYHQHSSIGRILVLFFGVFFVLGFFTRLDSFILAIYAFANIVASKVEMDRYSLILLIFLFLIYTFGLSSSYSLDSIVLPKMAKSKKIKNSNL